jgi:putative transposase
VPSLAGADEVAAELGVSRRQVYVLLQRFRVDSGLVTDLMPDRSSGGRGRSRLDDRVETIIHETVRKRFLSRQKRSVSVIYREIRRACLGDGLSAPAWNTVSSRIACLHPALVAASRGGPDAARPLLSAGDEVPCAETILEKVQIDHTVIDLIVVDQRERQPIGRPYLTLGFDEASRCVVGMVVTLEPPSATSVGLCLAHMTGDKRAWLDDLGVKVAWPMAGKPERLYVDNATEFKSEALRRGCEQHGIELSYRPLGRPHYGGIIERIIGTVMGWVHELPGTTFSNPTERGAYDSDKQAALTMGELTRWLALAVSSYHGTVHSTLRQTPAGRWADGVARCGTPPVVADRTAFLVDFLPVIRRKLTRIGFVVDHVHYFADVLKPWIARRDQLGKFIIRRDPRGISRIWVLDPDGDAYVPVPYRNVTHPAVSVWEHRQALDQLKQRGIQQVYEQALFGMIDQMRRIAEEATKTTRRTRRAAERRRHSPDSTTLRQRPGPPPDPPEADGDLTAAPAPWFAEIEQW